MRAVVYDKPFTVTVREVEKPKILHPDDIIVKGKPCVPQFVLPLSASCATSDDNMHLWKVGSDVQTFSHCSSICVLSDLHMYEGRTAAQSGIVFGHEK